MSLAELPADILLQIFKFIDFGDALTISSVCRAFRGLTSEKTFWISILEAESSHRTLPCPPYQDFTTLPLEELKNLVVHDRKLWRNFDRPSPVATSHLVISTQDGPEFLVTISGTEFFLVYSETGLLTGWSHQTGESFGSVQLEPGYFYENSSCMHECGACSVLFYKTWLTPPRKISFVVVRVEYSSTQAKATISVSYQCDRLSSNDTAPEYADYVLFAPNLIVISSQVYGKTLELWVVDIASGGLNIVQTDIAINSVYKRICIRRTLENSLRIIIEAKSEDTFDLYESEAQLDLTKVIFVPLQRLSGRSYILPSLPFTIWDTMEISAGDFSRSTTFAAALCKTQPADSATLAFIFWDLVPSRDELTGKPFLRTPVFLDIPHNFEYNDWQSVYAQTPSCADHGVITLFEGEKYVPCLLLIRRNDQESGQSPSFHPLNLPAEITFEEYGTDMAFDGRLGIVLLASKAHKSICVLRYA